MSERVVVDLVAASALVATDSEIAVGIISLHPDRVALCAARDGVGL